MRARQGLCESQREPCWGGGRSLCRSETGPQGSTWSSGPAALSRALGSGHRPSVWPLDNHRISPARSEPADPHQAPDPGLQHSHRKGTAQPASPPPSPVQTDGLGGRGELSRLPQPPGAKMTNGFNLVICWDVEGVCLRPGSSPRGRPFENMCHSVPSAQLQRQSQSFQGSRTTARGSRTWATVPSG